MSTKSKHKPVTLAKSVVQYDHADVGNAVLDETSHDERDTVEVKSEKSSAKQAKAIKAKPQQDATDVTAIYRSLAERTLDQARQTYSKAHSEVLSLSDKLEESSSALAKGSSAVQSYVVNAMQAQADDAFGYFRALTEIKTMSDAIELQSSHSRKTLDASLRQFKDLSALVNDMVVKASTPIRSALPIAKS